MSNCPTIGLIGGCEGTQFGCCSDGITAGDNPDMSNCPNIGLIGGCEGTQFGCCKDGSYANDLEKSNCKEIPVKTNLLGESGRM